MKVFKKLSKEELKTITAGARCSGCSNPPQGGNGGWQKICGSEPPICASAEWIAWKACLDNHYLAGPEPSCT
ncbi:hypothetical protein [Flavobacterium sp.]|uniref:bacteriocin-like protein n=1 Tax=Flavobacterium sp. TaxID=239 RepID=UPI00261EDA62|nr:hypothetical protein [Flavobacterium sp.]